MLHQAIAFLIGFCDAVFTGAVATLLFLFTKLLIDRVFPRLYSVIPAQVVDIITISVYFSMSGFVTGFLNNLFLQSFHF